MAVYEQPFDPTNRVVKAVAAFKSIGEGIRVKGFLGPSLREDNALPSVGVSSARRAGVIVDDNGKMRCPPGTPNANQFTDINMSNCMVPSAETAARQAADAAAELAKKSVDGFKRGTHGKKQKDREAIPQAGVGFANADGFLEQRRIPKGNSVVSPIDGSQRQLTELDDSIKHLAEGGPLSDIPDEHLVRAILANSAPEQQGLSDVRFQIFGTGGGVNGMIRMRDTRTGAAIGVKYNNGNTSGDEEAMREVASEIFLEHMGYEPTPMRIVPEVTDTDWGGEMWSGIALVTELAHNRNEGSIESGRMADRDYKYDYDVDPSEVVRMSLVDSVLNNSDRHEGNFMIARDEGGKGTIVPIDHSLGLRTPFMEDTPVEQIVRPIFGQGIEQVLASYWDSPNREKLVQDVEDAQKILAQIDTEKLKKDFEQFFLQIGFQGSAPSDRQKEWILAAIPRIESLKSPEATQKIADAILPEWRRPNPPVENLEDWAEEDLDDLI